MSQTFPDSIVIDGQSFTLTNGKYRNQNTGELVPAGALIDLTIADTNDPPKQSNRGPYSGTITALKHWRPTVLCWNRPLNPAKNIPEIDPNPPLGWETEDPGWSRTPEIICRYSYP